MPCIAAIVLTFIAGALTGYILTMRYMIVFISHEHDKTKNHHRRLTDNRPLNRRAYSALPS